QQWFRTDAWLSVLDKTLMILLCGSFLYYPAVFGDMTINKFLLSQEACTAVAILCVLAILFRRGISFNMSKPSLLNKNLLRAVIPFAAIVLLMSVHYRLDGFLLERIYPNGAYEAGVYAAAYRLLDASNMVGFLFASFLLPFIARQWSEKKDIQTVVLGTRHLLLMFSVTIASLVFFLAPWIQKVLYHHTDPNSITVLQWCLPALIGYSLVQIYGTVMTATGLIIPFCYITLISVIINITLNLLLIPAFGAKGCCIAALASQWFCGIAAMVYVKQKTGVRFHPGSLLIYIFTGTILSGFLYWGNSLPVSKWLLISAAGIITLLIMITTKILNLKSWAASLKKII
ncbi:MAG: polysaccharide biosynthesis C-terminal domain-containing protein, partial [Bacteroidia bacterium]|nr:polysaccharide biosynthesis C-terminal domain-containing protein [Bacteroidia bacterium]